MSNGNREFGRKIETLGNNNPGLQGQQGDSGDGDPQKAQAQQVFKPPKPDFIDSRDLPKREIDPNYDDRISEIQRSTPLSSVMEEPTRPGLTPVTARIFDPRKIQHRQLQDINRNLIDQLNREDRETARRQEAVARESRIRRDKALSELQKRLDEQQDREIFEQKKGFEREGIEYETDFEGRPKVKRDKEGRVVYKEKKGAVEYDEKTGRAYRMDRTATGAYKKVQLDKDAEIGPDTSPELLTVVYAG